MSPDPIHSLNTLSSAEAARLVKPDGWDRALDRACFEASVRDHEHNRRRRGEFFDRLYGRTPSAEKDWRQELELPAPVGDHGGKEQRMNQCPGPRISRIQAVADTAAETELTPLAGTIGAGRESGLEEQRVNQRPVTSPLPSIQAADESPFLLKIAVLAAALLLFLPTLMS